MDEIAAVRDENALHAAHERVELRRRIVIVVEIDAAETGEHRIRGAQLGQELATSRMQSLVTRRKDPASRHLLRQQYGGFIVRVERCGGCGALQDGAA